MKIEFVGTVGLFREGWNVRDERGRWFTSKLLDMDGMLVRITVEQIKETATT
jgi:hypothetical protein